MFCSKCGAQVDEGAAFCGECGNPLVNQEISGQIPNSDFSSQPVPMAQPNQPAQNGSAAANVDAGAMPSVTPQVGAVPPMGAGAAAMPAAAPPKKNNNLFIIAAILAVVVIVAAVGLVLTLSRCAPQEAHLDEGTYSVLVYEESTDEYDYTSSRTVMGLEVSLYDDGSARVSNPASSSSTPTMGKFEETDEELKGSPVYQITVNEESKTDSWSNYDSYSVAVPAGASNGDLAGWWVFCAKSTSSSGISYATFVAEVRSDGTLNAGYGWGDEPSDNPFGSSFNWEGAEGPDWGIPCNWEIVSKEDGVLKVKVTPKEDRWSSYYADFKMPLPK